MNIPVTNVNELYIALNQKAKAGDTITMAANTYKLDALQPNKGRIEFLENMTIQGQMNHADQVVIDGSALMDDSFVPPNEIPAKRTGIIRMGNGTNTLAWVKVIGTTAPKALSVIDTDLVTEGTKVAHVKIEHCIITKGRIGIDLRNVSSRCDQRELRAEILFNELVQNDVSDPGTQQGQGIVFQNANGVKGASVQATLKGNNIHLNTIGTRIFNNVGAGNPQTAKNTITVSSNNDKFEDNKLGMYISAGLNNGSSFSVVVNSITLEARRTNIRNNKGIAQDAITLPCGIFVTGGSKSVDTSESSKNSVVLKFTDCLFEQNQNVDIIAYGAFSTTSTVAGTDNFVNIHLQGKSKTASVNAVNSKPNEPAGTNVVAIRKS